MVEFNVQKRHLQIDLLVCIRRLVTIALFVLLFVCITSWAGSNLEESVCGLEEPILFKGWSQSAGTPGSTPLSGFKNIESISIESKDHRILRGYKFRGQFSKNIGTTQGYLLVAQGNAMLAEHIIEQFQPFTENGYDVYVFDYRGYGRSEGKPRFKGILSDYKEIVGHLNSLGYQNSIYYGLSFGGVVLLNALKGKLDNKRVVIDSARSRFSKYGCPKNNDPINNLPKNCSNFLVIAGQKDRVVTPDASKELLKLAKQRGASILEHPKLNHPFMDMDRSLHDYRMNVVRFFLLGR